MDTPRKNRALATLVMALACGGCSRSLDFSLPTDAQLGLSIELPDRPAQSCTIPAGSTRMQALSRWLEANRTGWGPMLATDGAGGVRVYGQGFALQFDGNMAILSRGDGMLTHSTRPAEYAFLRCGDDSRGRVQ